MIKDIVFDFGGVLTTIDVKLSWFVSFEMPTSVLAEIIKFIASVLFLEGESGDASPNDSKDN